MFCRTRGVDPLRRLSESNNEIEERDGQWLAVADFEWGSGKVTAGGIIDETWIEQHEGVDVAHTCPTLDLAT